jgi:hypothetical protein
MMPFTWIFGLSVDVRPSTLEWAVINPSITGWWWLEHVLFFHKFYFSICWEFHHPNWLIFFRGVGKIKLGKIWENLVGGLNYPNLYMVNPHKYQRGRVQPPTRFVRDFSRTLFEDSHDEMTIAIRSLWLWPSRGWTNIWLIYVLHIWLIYGYGDISYIYNIYHIYISYIIYIYISIYLVTLW